MNWLFIIVIIILIGYGAKGHRDGFIKTMFSIFSVMIALTITTVLNPYVSKAIQNNKGITSFVSKKVAIALDMEKEEDGVTGQVKAIDQLTIPKALKNALVENNNKEVYKALVVNKFENYVSHYLAVVVLNAATFFCIFVLCMVLLCLLCQGLDLFSKLPVINGLNKTAGLLVGVLRGLVILWILCIVLTIFSGTHWSKGVYGSINESVFLSSIYNNNLLLQLITNLAKVVF